MIEIFGVPTRSIRAILLCGSWYYIYRDESLVIGGGIEDGYDSEENAWFYIIVGSGQRRDYIAGPISSIEAVRGVEE